MFRVQKGRLLKDPGSLILGTWRMCAERFNRKVSALKHFSSFPCREAVCKSWLYIVPRTAPAFAFFDFFRTHTKESQKPTSKSPQVSPDVSGREQST